MSPEQPPLSPPPLAAKKPKHRGPKGSTDCHFHIFGPHDRYALSPGRGYTPSEESNIRTYQTMADTVGIDRMVIVNPTPYGKDHTATIDSIEIFGRDRTRAVAVIDESFSDATLRGFASRGFVAARVNDVNTNTTRVSKLDEIVPRIAPLGWHLEVYVEGSALPGLEAKLLSLPVPFVIDHMGRIPTSRGIDSPEFKSLLRLLESGKCWIKLCGYRSSVQGPPYDDLLEEAQKIIAIAPDKCVWGTDWPHPRREGPLLPDDGTLIDLLYDWSGNDEQFHRILVENPAKLYHFPSS
jgi:predicted TIM-barrel fold metal-dependent hydrolase